MKIILNVNIWSSTNNIYREIFFIFRYFNIAYYSVGSLKNDITFSLFLFCLFCLMAYQLFLGYLMPKPFS